MKENANNNSNNDQSRSPSFTMSNLNLENNLSNSNDPFTIEEDTEREEATVCVKSADNARIFNNPMLIQKMIEEWNFKHYTIPGTLAVPGAGNCFLHQNEFE